MQKSFSFVFRKMIGIAHPSNYLPLDLANTLGLKLQSRKVTAYMEGKTLIQNFLIEDGLSFISFLIMWRTLSPALPPPNLLNLFCVESNNWITFFFHLITLKRTISSKEVQFLKPRRNFNLWLKQYWSGILPMFLCIVSRRWKKKMRNIYWSSDFVFRLKW